jgi:hypothetical protein
VQALTGLTEDTVCHTQPVPCWSPPWNHRSVGGGQSLTLRKGMVGILTPVIGPKLTSKGEVWQEVPPSQTEVPMRRILLHLLYDPRPLQSLDKQERRHQRAEWKQRIRNYKDSSLRRSQWISYYVTLLDEKVWLYCLVMLGSFVIGLLVTVAFWALFSF